MSDKLTPSDNCTVNLNKRFVLSEMSHEELMNYARIHVSMDSRELIDVLSGRLNLERAINEANQDG